MFYEHIFREKQGNGGRGGPASVHPLIARLRRQRRMLDMTQEELGDAIGCSESHISQVECGKRFLRVADFARACEIVGLEIILREKTDE